MADYRIFIGAEESELRERLISRKAKGGITREAAEAHYERSDGPNVRRVLEHVCPHEEGYRMVEVDGVTSLIPEEAQGADA